MLCLPQDLHIRFKTDNHNCGIDSSEDPGWIATWDFIANGQDICHPDAGTLPMANEHPQPPAQTVLCLSKPALLARMPLVGSWFVPRQRVSRETL